MLRDDIARYTELSGNDGEHTPIGIIGAFLDGYETGLKDRPKGEWVFYDEEFYQQGRFANVAHRIRECSICHHKIADFVGNMNFCPNCGADMRGKENDK